MRSLLVLFGLFVTSTAFSAGLITKTSTYDVPTTIDRLVSAVEAKGMKVFARIDHAGGAASIGKTLAPTQVLIFGSPKAGTPLMLNDARVALDLPLRVLAYQDADGNTQVMFHDPRGLREDYELGELPVPDKMLQMLNALTDLATAP